MLVLKHSGEMLSGKVNANNADADLRSLSTHRHGIELDVSVYFFSVIVVNALVLSSLLVWRLTLVDLVGKPALRPALTWLVCFCVCTVRGCPALMCVCTQ